MTGRTQDIAGVSVAVLALAVAAYGLYLVLIGPEATFVPAVPIGAPPGDPVTRTVPAPQGSIPLGASLLVLAGLAAGRMLVAWLGALAILAFAALFVFGVGGILLPLSGALLVALGVHGRSRDRLPRSPTRTPYGRFP